MLDTQGLGAQLAAAPNSRRAQSFWLVVHSRLKWNRDTWVTVATLLDVDTVAGADRFGNVVVLDIDGLLLTHGPFTHSS